MDMEIKEIQALENQLFKEVVRVCDQYGVKYFAAYGTVLGAIRHGGIIPWDDDVDIYVPENELDHFLEAMEKGLDQKYWVDFRTPGRKYRDFPRVGFKEYDTEILHIDVFRLTGAPDDLKQQKRERWICGRIHLLNNVKRRGVKSFRGRGDKERKAKLATVLSAPLPLSLSVKMVDYYAKKYPYETADYVGSVVSRFLSSVFPKSFLGDGILVPYEDFQIRVPERYEDYLNQMYRDYRKLPPQEKREAALNRIYHANRDPETGLIHID